MAIRKVLVWDAPTRLFHWLSVVLVAACYITFRLSWTKWHVLTGEALLALVVFRLLWGVFGSDTSRFSRFLVSPMAGIRHLSHLHHREPDTQIGHNAAGGWMVLVLILLLLGLTLTGVYVNNDIADQGPFTELAPAPVANLINKLHRILWDALLAAIVLHVLAVLTYAVVKRHNLLWPMLTGRKRLPPEFPGPRMASITRALLLLAVAGAATAAMVAWL